MKTQNKKQSGFTLVEIMIVVAIIGLLAAIAIPNFVRARTTSQTNACISNLRIIDGAKGSWALEQHKQTTDTPLGTDIQPYMGRGSAGELPCCPNDSAQTFDTSYAPAHRRQTDLPHRASDAQLAVGQCFDWIAEIKTQQKSPEESPGFFYMECGGLPPLS